MAMDIHHMNVRSWETLLLSTLKLCLLKTAVRSLKSRKFWKTAQEQFYSPACS